MEVYLDEQCMVGSILKKSDSSKTFTFDSIRDLADFEQSFKLPSSAMTKKIRSNTS